MTIVINKNTSAKEFDKILKDAEKKRKSKKGFDSKKITKPIKSFLGIDPVKFQRQIRDEE